jgi:hypothetical protein
LRYIENAHFQPITMQRWFKRTRCDQCDDTQKCKGDSYLRPNPRRVRPQRDHREQRNHKERRHEPRGRPGDSITAMRNCGKPRNDVALQIHEPHQRMRKQHSRSRNNETERQTREAEWNNHSRQRHRKRIRQWTQQRNTVEIASHQRQHPELQYQRKQKNLGNSKTPER